MATFREVLSTPFRLLSVAADAVCIASRGMEQARDFSNLALDESGYLIREGQKAHERGQFLASHLIDAIREEAKKDAKSFSAPKEWDDTFVFSTSLTKAGDETKELRAHGFIYGGKDKDRNWSKSSSVSEEDIKWLESQDFFEGYVHNVAEEAETENKVSADTPVQF